MQAMVNEARINISTHALREEGDLTNAQYVAQYTVFLPTPSARRATRNRHRLPPGLPFLPTPSARRATASAERSSHMDMISTHALREEGDTFTVLVFFAVLVFLPTPSARRATSSAVS